MYRLFYFLLLLYPLQAIATPLYTVKLALYKDRALLQEELAKFSPTLHKTISIQKDKEYYRVSTLPTHNKKVLSKLLPYYQKVFSDAFIDTIKVEKKIDKNISKKNDAFYTTVKNKVFYLCANTPQQKNKKFLIEVIFTDTSVTYIPILGKIPSMKAEYKIQDNKLFLYQKDLFNPKVYSTYEKSYPKYHLIHSWANGKKLQSLRYYLIKDDAKKYLEN